MPHHHRTLAAGLLALAVASCALLDGPGLREAATLSMVSGDRQAAPPATPLPAPLILRVLDRAGRPVPAQTVRFEVTAGDGALSATSVRSDTLGEVRVQWVLGSAGRQEVQAVARTTGTATELSPVTFTATLLPDPPRSATAVAGDGQSAAAGATLPDTLRVRVLNGRGRPLPGVEVRWTVTGGGGSVQPSTSLTDSAGVARTRWTLGFTGGRQTLSATVGELPPLTFAATATPPAVATLTKAGDNQTGMVDRPVQDSLAVTARMADGRPAAGVPVTWSVAGGGGRILSPAVVLTGADGVARAQWQLGRTAGQNSATATVAGQTPATFSATGRPDTLVALERVSGDGQVAVAGTSLAQPLVVRVADRFGNAVAGRSVRWSVTGGGGSISLGGTATGTSAAGITGTTGADGTASATLTIGTAAGRNEVRVSIAGPATDSVVTFTASGGWPATTTITKSFDQQTGAAGQPLPNALAVTVRLPDNRPAVGATVTWTVQQGGGNLGGQTTATSVTDAAGVARISWTLGPAAGANQLEATVIGLPAVTFSATAQ